MTLLLTEQVLEIIKNLNDIVSTSQTQKSQEKLQNISDQMVLNELACTNEFMNPEVFVKGVEECSDIAYMKAIQKQFILMSEYIQNVLIRDEKNTHKYVLDIVRKVAKSLL